MIETLIISSVFFFVITSILGIYLSFCAYRNKPRSRLVIIIHGMLSFAGFGIVFHFVPHFLITILLFSLATICGIILLYQELKKVKFTVWLFFAHAILTTLGFVFLIVESNEFIG